MSNPGTGLVGSDFRINTSVSGSQVFPRVANYDESWCNVKFSGYTLNYIYEASRIVTRIISPIPP
jgi:hypothetical protein